MYALGFVRASMRTLLPSYSSKLSYDTSLPEGGYISLLQWLAKRPEGVRKQLSVVFPRVCIPLAVYCQVRRYTSNLSQTLKLVQITIRTANMSRGETVAGEQRENDV